MRNKAATSPIHAKWHRRVEGQINHTINTHPKWFVFKDKHDRVDCVNSLAKRIVGEIVAAPMLANSRAMDDDLCPQPVNLALGEPDKLENSGVPPRCATISQTKAKGD